MPQTAAKGPSRAQALGLSLLLACAIGAGLWAVTSTRRIAAQTTKPAVANELALARRSKQLDSWRASLDRALRSRPPALPNVPRYAPVARVPVVHVAPLPAFVPAVRTPAAATTRRRPTPAPAPARAPAKPKTHVAAPAVTTTAPAPAPPPTTTAPGGGQGDGWTGGGDD